MATNQYGRMLPPMNSRRSGARRNQAFIFHRGDLVEKRLHPDGALMGVLPRGVLRELLDERGKARTDPRFHDRQFIGKITVDDHVSPAKLRNDVAQLGAAHEVPVTDGLPMGVIAKLRIPHDPAEHSHVRPPHIAALPIPDLGKRLGVQAELLFLPDALCHLGEESVQRIDEEDLIPSQAKNPGCPSRLPVLKLYSGTSTGSPATSAPTWASINARSRAWGVSKS